MKKKFYLLRQTLLILSMLVFSAPGWGIGVNQTFTNDGFTYRVTAMAPSYTVTVIACSKSGTVYVPEKVPYEDLEFTVTRGGGNGSFYNVEVLYLPNTIVGTDREFLDDARKNLKEIHLGSQVKLNTYMLTYRLESLQRWYVDENNPNYKAINYMLVDKKTGNLLHLPPSGSFVDDNGKFVIPEDVTDISYVSKWLDKNKTKVKSIVLPSTYTGDYLTFRDKLPALEEFEVASGNSKYQSVDGVLLNKDGTQVLAYPMGKTTEDYVVPDGVTSIASKAFNEAKFKTLDLNGVATLKKECIFNCTNLTTLTIPAELETIPEGAIVGCTSLEAYIVKPGNPTYSATDGVLFTDGGQTLLLYPSGKTGDTYTFPTSPQVTKIASKAFSSAKVKTLTIPETVTEIGTYAFESSNLTSMTWPEQITAIPEGCFHSCKGLTTFEIPTTVNSVGTSAFAYSGIVSITWPESVTVIPTSCFNNCKSLYSFNIPSTVTSLGVSAFYESGISEVNFSPNNSITTISDHCFYNTSNLTQITIPDNVTTIERYAFCGSRLNSLEIHKGITTIGDEAFASNRITSLTFAEDCAITAFGTSAFRGNLLTEVTLPASLTSLGNSCFQSCIYLKTINVPDGSELKTISVFGAPNLEVLDFKGSCDNLTSISNDTFNGFTKLQTVLLPSSVKNIGARAFINCVNLANLRFDGVENIGEAAFKNCGMETLNFPESVKKISREAFMGCELLTTVSLSKNANDISSEAFVGCKTLTAINVDKNNETYSSSDGILLSKDKETLRIFPEGKANNNFTLLPPSITTIGDHSFYCNENLTNITIPNKVNTIGARAFGGCKNLNTVTMLCDEMIDPENIDQALNTMSFDDGSFEGYPSIFGNITLNVRKELLTNYQGNEYYRQFGSIKPSFVDETSRAGGLNKTNAKEEFIAVSDNTVDLLSVDTEDETYVLPTTVKQGNKTYAVSLVGDYLFTANGSQVSNVKEVVVPGNVQYIGARAFMTNGNDLTSTTSTVENVFLIGETLNEDLLSTARFELTAEDLGSSTTNRYDEFGSDTKIYVRKSAEETYKTTWSNYADNITYKIPFTQTGEYGTFAREFDVDFSEVNGVNEENPVTDDPVVIAFTGDGKYNVRGDSYYVHMTSINLGDQTGKDGTYVPAGSGVLIKKYKDADLYYQIAETGVSEAFVEGNFMKGVTLRKETIETADGVSRFYISGGVLHEMTQPKQFGNHKSYMEISNDDIPAGAKVMLSFVDMDEGTTGIDGMMTDENADDANKVYYNLNGQRVNTPSKGIYIVNGKKVIVK